MTLLPSVYNTPLSKAVQLGYAVEIYASTAALPSERWNAVVQQAGAGLFYHSEWLAGLERAKFESVADRWYLIIRERASGADVAVFPFEVVRNSAFWHTYLIEGESTHLGGLNWVCGPSLYGFGGPLPCVPTANSLAIVSIIGSVGQQLAQDVGAAGCAVHNVPESTSAVAALSEMAAVALVLDANCIAQTRSSIEEYIAALPKHVRDDLKRRRRRAGERGLAIEVAEGNAQAVACEELYTLLVEPFDRHRVPSLYSTYGLAEILKLPYTRLLVARAGGKVIGAFVLLLHERTLYVWAGGIDYSQLRDYSTYAVLLYEALVHAHSSGMTHIEFGRANLRFKHKFGFQPSRLHSFFWLISPTRKAAGQLRKMASVLATRIPERETE